MTTATEDSAANFELPLGMSENDAAEEMLKRFLPPDAKQPSKAKGEDESETKADVAEEDETSAEKPEDEASDEDEGDEAKEEEEGESEYVAKIKVGDEEHEVPISKLTRLYGQEAALTKKSMEVAELRKKADTDLATNTAATNSLLTRAKARFEPYSKLDFNLLAAQAGKEGQLTVEEYQALRQGAQAAYEDVQFLENQLGQFSEAIQKRHADDIRARATECIKVLTGPADKGGIEGWNEQLYSDIRTFAASKGAPTDVINQMVDPWAFQILHSAMLYERGKSKGKVVTTKVNKTPKKIVKTTNSPAADKRSGGPETAAIKKAEARFHSSGSQDDAAELMLARWNARRSAADAD